MTTNTKPVPLSAGGLTLNGEELLTLHDVLSLTGISRSTLTAFKKFDLLPKPMTLGSRTQFWKRAEIERFMADRAELLARTQPKAKAA